MSQPNEDDDYEVSDSEGEDEVGEIDEDYVPSPKKMPSTEAPIANSDDEEDKSDG